MQLLIILANIICIYGLQVLQKHNLRGMFDKEKTQIINKIIRDTYKQIYFGAIDNAKLGKNDYKFTIMCVPLDNNNSEFMFINKQFCNNKQQHEQVLASINKDRGYGLTDGYQSWKQQNPITIEYKINENTIINDLMNMVNITFTDSNITTTYENCCDYYTISW
jgi:hypothetical protein